MRGRFKRTFYPLIVVVLILLTSYCALSVSASPKKKTSTGKSSLKKDEQVISQKSFNVSVVTWNLAEKKVSESDGDFLKLHKDNDFVVLGVQECENIKPRREEGHRSKAWRSIQRNALGKGFDCVAEHKMGGLQIAVFAKKKVAKQVQGLQIIDVACGIGNVIANKGAVCVLLRMQGKTVAFVNAHLAAHKTKVRQRNADYHRIMDAIAVKAQPRWLRPSVAQKRRHLMGGKAKKPWLDKMFDAVGFPGDDTTSTASSSSASSPSAAYSGRSSSKSSSSHKKGSRRDNGKEENRKRKLRSVRMFSKRGENRGRSGKDAVGGSGSGSGTMIDNECLFDAIIFMGDLNYRLDLPRLEVELYKESLPDKTSESEQDSSEGLEDLLEFDQLIRERVLGHCFAGFSEGAISFMPTFKYDKGSDKFDTSSKERPPAWTDRILFRFVERQQPKTTNTDTEIQTAVAGKGKKTENKNNIADKDPSVSCEIQDTSFFSSSAIEEEGIEQAKKKPSPAMLTLTKYFSIDSRHSDHRPVSANFILNL